MANGRRSIDGDGTSGRGRHMARASGLAAVRATRRLGGAAESVAEVSLIGAGPTALRFTDGR